MFLNVRALLFWIFVIYFSKSEAVWLDDHGGYRDVLMAVDSSIEIEDCDVFLQKIEDLIDSFSRRMWEATNEKLHVASMDVVIPRDVALRCNFTVSAPRGLTWTEADFHLSDGWQTAQKWSPKGSLGVGVQQPLGCGRPGDFITIDYSLLATMSNPDEDDQSQMIIDAAEMTDSQKNATTLNRIGQSLLAAWAKYRWGVFEETPFEEDKQHLTNRCPEDAQLCENVTASQPEISILADVSRNATFCTVETHNPLVPNPQNLVCMGKSAWEVMLQHPDFKWSSAITSKVNVSNEYDAPRVPHQRSTEELNELFSPQKDLPRGDHKDGISDVIVKERHVRELKRTEDSSLSQSETDSFVPPLEVGSLVLEEVDSLTLNRSDPQSGTYNSSQSEEILEDDVIVSSFIGGLPPVTTADKFDKNNSDLNDSSLKILTSKLYGASLSPYKIPPHTSETAPSVSWVTAVHLPTNSSPTSNHSVTWIRGQELNGTIPSLVPNILQPSKQRGPPHTTTRLVSYQAKTVIVALDLSISSVAQASVEWLRGGILRWMFGIGEDISFGVLASYSNTSFPLLGPIAPSLISERHLEEQMALLPYQHEVDDEVYGGKYCLSCVINEAEKMFENAGLPVESGVLILTMCQPQLSTYQMDLISKSPLIIHTITMCPNAPLYVEKLATSGGSWALSSDNMGSGITAEVQLGHLLTEICRETILWPTNSRLQTIHEEDKLLRREDVENVGAFQRVKGTIKMSRSKKPRLFVITSSSPAKVVELWSGKNRIPLHRDTTRRYWAILEDDINSFSYSLKFLSTSLELPLTLATGVYERSEDSDFHITLRTNTRRYRPGNRMDPYLTVWAEVTKDRKPVLDADVTLSVTYLSGHSPATYSLMLLDDGSTEPDIRRGDGIYSRYLTWTPGTGRYILTAKASTATSAFVVQNGRGTRQQTGPFQVSSSSASLVVEMVPGGDFFPPSRITDLSVTPMKNSHVNITWSAPGGDLDQGSAWRYQLKMYTESAALNQERFDSSGIDVYCLQGEEQAPTPAPALFGTPQYCVTSIPFSNLQWYFAMRAIDGANNTGKISNIVSIFIYEATTKSLSKQSPLQEDIVQTVIMSTFDSEVTAATDEDSNWYIFGIALVAAILLVMISIVVFACVFCCRKSKTKDDKDPERPIYKIYVNNAYIQEEDGEIKVVNKDKTLDEKEKTQQWVNSLDRYDAGDVHRDENPADISAETNDSTHTGKGSKPVRFGVLTNGSIMREVPSSSSSSSSKPSDEAIPDDFKYKDLSETISNSTSDGATGSTSSAATEISTDTIRVKDPIMIQYQGLHHNASYESTYQPLGIPTLPGPTVISIHSNFHDGYNSDEDGGFRQRSAQGPGPRKHLPSQFSSFRYLPTTEEDSILPVRTVDSSPTFNTVSRATNTPLPHGTVRSVKKRRHISFV